MRVEGTFAPESLGRLFIPRSRDFIRLVLVIWFHDRGDTRDVLYLGACERNNRDCFSVLF